ncbi:hypothetical protein [Zongyangia hominis]|uniref:D-alanyl-lipoteichoic acid biosynthesis protein DltB n=1 Tax=Zongyangia hominis TaxID=2763677 RepID=A0A926ECZ0_9FIRM|nr:hypothetical protein [Zongyangia hominis]MBC8570790.1 hypothetical protein [Zongyangia hominis]
MQPDSLLFIYLFLPVSLIVYYLVPAKGRNTVLLLLSLVVFLSLDILFTPLLIASCLIDYMAGRVIEKNRDKNILCRFILCVAAAKDLTTVIVMIVYRDMFHFILPLGSVVVSLLSLSYVYDIYRERAKAQKNPVNMLAYAMMFPRLYYGPLTRYGQMEYDLGHRKASLSLMCDGLILFIQGLAKKVLIADGITRVLEMIAQLPVYNQSTLSCWIYFLSKIMWIYFFYCGYLEMGAGLCMVFGFNVRSGFHHPYMAKTVTSFLNRFNNSLQEYVEHYVFDPLQSRLRSPWLKAAALFLALCIICAFYKASVNLALGAVLLTGLLCYERWNAASAKRQLKPPSVLAHLGVMAAIGVFMLLAMTGSPLEARKMLGYLVGLGGGMELYNQQIIYILTTNYAALIVGVIFCSDLFSRLASKFSRSKSYLVNLIIIVVNVLILVVTTAYLIR